MWSIALSILRRLWHLPRAIRMARRGFFVLFEPSGRVHYIDPLEMVFRAQAIATDDPGAFVEQLAAGLRLPLWDGKRGVARADVLDAWSHLVELKKNFTPTSPSWPPTERVFARRGLENGTG